MYLISKKIAVTLYKQSYIEKKEIETIRFAIEFIITQIFTLTIILLLGIIIEKLFSTIVFIFTFGTLRLLSNGYHAKTFIKCIIIA